jgi:hypothetical protein
VTLPLENDLELEVRGRDAIEGLPDVAISPILRSDRKAGAGRLMPIVRVVNDVLNQASAELATDMRNNGLISVGGALPEYMISFHPPGQSDRNRRAVVNVLAVTVAPEPTSSAKSHVRSLARVDSRMVGP